MSDLNSESVQNEKVRVLLKTSNNVSVESDMETITPDNIRKGKKPRVKLVPVLIPVIEYDGSDSNESDDNHDKSQMTLPNVGCVTLKTPKNIQDLSTFKLLEDSQFSAINHLQESVTNPLQSNSLYVVDKNGKSKSKVTLPPGMCYNNNIKDDSETSTRITKVVPKTAPSESKTSYTTINTMYKPKHVGPNIITIRKQQKCIDEKYKTTGTQCTGVPQEEIEIDGTHLKIVSLMSGHEQVRAAMTGSFSSSSLPLKVGCDLSVKQTRSYSRKNPVVAKLVDSMSGEVVGLSNSVSTLDKTAVLRYKVFKTLNAENSKTVDLETYIMSLSELSDFPKSTVEDIAKLNLTMGLNKFRRGEYKYLQPLENGEVICPICEDGLSMKAVLRKHIMKTHGIDSVFQFPKFMALLKIFKGRTLYKIEELKCYRNLLDEILNYSRWNTKKKKSVSGAKTNDETLSKNASANKTANQNEENTNSPKSLALPSDTPSTSTSTKQAVTSTPAITASKNQLLENKKPPTTHKPNVVLISRKDENRYSNKHFLLWKKINETKKSSMVGKNVQNVTKSENLAKRVVQSTGGNKPSSGSEFDEDNEIGEDCYEITRRNYFRSFLEMPPERYFCHVCAFKSEELEEYFNHRLSHIPQAQCPLCQIFLPGITASSGLFAHLESKHNSESGIDDDNNLVITNKNLVDGEQLIVPEIDYQPPDDKVTIEYHCQGCGFFSLQFEVYMEHVKTDHVKPCKCKICNEAFNHELEMVEHLKICEMQQKYVFNSEKFNKKYCGPYTCSYCHKEYSKKNRFMSHLATHNVDRYFCVFCKKGFFKKAVLRTHYGEQHEFGCRKCKVEFTNTRDLWNHRFNHQKKHVLVCEYCGKTFNNMAYYKDHLNFHKGIKTHTCKFCGEKFSYYSSLELHRNKVHSDQLKQSFLCSHCGIQYKVNKLLYQHIRIVHEGSRRAGPAKDPHWRKRKRVRKNFGPSAPRRVRDASTGKLVPRDSIINRVRRRIRDPVTGELVHRDSIPKPTPKRRIKTSPRKRQPMKQTLDCQHCGNGFSLTSELWKHLELHKNVSNYQCQCCQLYFTSKTNLNTHIDMKYCEQISQVAVSDIIEEVGVTDSDEDYVPPKKRVRVFYTKPNNSSNLQAPSTSSQSQNNISSPDARPTIFRLGTGRAQVVYAREQSNNRNFEEEIAMAIESVVDTETVVTQPANGFAQNQDESILPVGEAFIIVSQGEQGPYPNFNYYQEFM